MTYLLLFSLSNFSTTTGRLREKNSFFNKLRSVAHLLKISIKSRPKEQYAAPCFSKSSISTEKPNSPDNLTCEVIFNYRLVSSAISFLRMDMFLNNLYVPKNAQYNSLLLITQKIFN